MSLFTLFSGMLGNAVGNNQKNDTADVRTTKSNLQKAGYFSADDKESADNPFLTRKMDDGIKKFQKDNNLKIDGIMKPSGETERTLYERLTGKSADDVFILSQKDTSKVGFGGNISGTLVPIPKKKPNLSLKERKTAILDDKKEGVFYVVNNPNADNSEPWYTFNNYSEVQKNKQIIEGEAKKADIDSDLVKAIVHLETTQGYYDGYVPAKMNKTIRPMNVHAEYWKDLGYSRDDLTDPKKNIQAGIELLKRIKKRMPNASVDKVASVYNALDARYVSDYGARIKKLVKEKPWEKQK